jgi:hypothetical protein
VRRARPVLPEPEPLQQIQHALPPKLLTPLWRSVAFPI